jgi:hypothetical protein
LHPRGFAEVGDILRVRIIRFNKESGDFVASRKELHPEEGDETTG